MTRPAVLRSGFTLYEVVLSLAILAGSLAILSSLIATGSRAATQSRLRTEAMLLCQTKLAEVVSGAEPLTAVSGAPLVGAAPEWTWELQVLAGPHVDLLELQVTVSHASANNSVDAKASLMRWIRNPQIFAATAASTGATAPSQPESGGS